MEKSPELETFFNLVFRNENLNEWRVRVKWVENMLEGECFHEGHEIALWISGNIEKIKVLFIHEVSHGIHDNKKPWLLKKFELLIDISESIKKIVGNEIYCRIRLFLALILASMKKLSTNTTHGRHFQAIQEKLVRKYFGSKYTKTMNFIMILALYD